MVTYKKQELFILREHIIYWWATYCSHF